MVINQKAIARAKVEKLKNGFSAFTETAAVTELVEKEVNKLGLRVHVDKTSKGCWFIPIKENE
ncbi:hypothetical protein L1765_11700 [Microaerobacter geothermalis]|uniref:hypothetical protein n=1 Tax=Microaerobacter geothermalis TaxID=674972 RepID=UPI001F22A905|nr:hypothetical protein [Microaerobacter geothermalis]MCF6094625.1 hypothetical protein [Microaerobacter geothermalis]